MRLGKKTCDFRAACQMAELGGQSSRLACRARWALTNQYGFDFASNVLRAWSVLVMGGMVSWLNEPVKQKLNSFVQETRWLQFAVSFLGKSNRPRCGRFRLDVFGIRRDSWRMAFPCAERVVPEANWLSAIAGSTSIRGGLINQH